MFKQKKRILVLMCAALVQAQGLTDATWTGAVNADLNTAGNWVGGVPSGVATFDSTYPAVQFSPTANAEFTLESFYFPKSASDFQFSFTGPGAMQFIGAGITGTNTNTQITFSNTGSLTTPQFFFNAIDAPNGSLGNASLIFTNSASGTISTGGNVGQLFLISAGFDVMAGDNGSLLFTNHGAISGSEEASQFFEKFSNFSVGNSYFLSAINSGGAAVIGGSSDTGQLLFDAGYGSANFTAGDSCTFIFTNENSATIASTGNDSGQVIFDAVHGPAGFTVGKNVSLTLTNSNSTISNLMSGNDAGQMIFDGDHGTASLTTADHAVISLSNESGGLVNGLGFDTGQIVIDGDRGTAFVSVGADASVTLTQDSGCTLHTGSDGNDVAQLLVDGNLGTAYLTIGDRGVLNIMNGGSITNAVDGGYAAQFLFDGSSMDSSSTLNTGSNVVITVTNSDGATITNTGANSAAQVYFASASIYGNPTINVVNGNPSIGSIQGIIFDGTSTADNTNISLTNTSLIVNTTSSEFTLASLSGDASSVVLLSNDLDINTYAGASTSFAGVISDASGMHNLTIDGSGTQSLSGSNTFGGSTTVNTGTLLLTGSLLNDVLVRRGTLTGTGSVGGTLSVNLGGTVAPTLGGSNTLTVADLDLTIGSTTNIEINPSGANSKISVTGTANLGGSVNVTQNAGTYPNTNEYTILTGATVNNAYNSTVTGGLPGFVFGLSYGGDNVYLSYQLYQIPTSGLSGNALKIADYLNHHPLASTLGFFQDLSESELPKALNSVSPSRNAFGTYIAEQTAFSLSASLSRHLDTLRSPEERSENAYMASLIADASDCVQTRKPDKKVLDSRNNLSTWISGFGEYAHQSASKGNPSFNFLSEALLAGVDYLGKTRDDVGGALGYAHTHFIDENNAGHGHINFYFASVYANFFYKNFYFSPALWGIFDQIQNTRHISFPAFVGSARANLYSWQLLPHLEVGYDTAFSWGEMIPFTALDWAIIWQRGYEEHGASPFNATSKSHSNSMLRSETGLKFCEKWAYCWGAFFLREKLSYVFQKPFGTGTVNSAFTGIPSSFTVTAVNKNLNLADVSLDFAVAIGHKKPTSISLGYEGEFGSSYWSNQLMLTIKKTF